jgi:ribonuclease BN (tRNA processing enzyme)
VKLTILGNNGPFPAAGGACSGYLVQCGGKCILIDCGNGVLANLQKFIRLEELDAIILTHLHSDHISDMFVLKYAVQIKRKRGQFDRTLEVYAPPEPSEEYGRLDVRDAFNLKTISADTVLKIGDFSITFAQMKHPSLDFAVRMECDGKKFVFSGDTSWTDEIISFSKGADLLMLDAGLLEKDFAEGAPHLTAAQCGIAASGAGAKKLLLTHFWPDYDVNELLEEARHSYANTEAARLLQSYEI